ncbi:hypothetical protein LCGC14_1334680 [marine sediment metagenome]|uniref:HTH cro/C1-type domain-containing protein n=1 Tax=marine sediment metagenome TaxID=412755 RepID=A0A0F9MWD1_9ZZZZ|nr:XRE family transcriptional regulator [Desulfobacterales bacterium]
MTKEKTIPWCKAFREYDDKTTPGIILRGARGKEGLTQIELSRKIGIPKSHISEMENGQRPIGKDTAKSLGTALNIGHLVFL